MYSLFYAHESTDFKRYICKRWREGFNKIWCSNLTYEITQRDDESNKKHLYNLPNADEYVQWQKLEQIDKALEDFYWYDRDVFKLYYYEGHTLTGLAKKTGISRNSLFTTIDKVREQLKELLDE